MAELQVPELPQIRRTSAGERSNYMIKSNISQIDLIPSVADSNNSNSRRQGKLHMTDTEALVNLVKGSLGSGFLAMPFAFSHSGLLVGIFGTLLVALVCTHCACMMVKCSQRLCRVESKDSMSYTDTVEAAYRIGAGGRFSKLAPIMRGICDSFIFFTYFGVITTYVIFIASTFKQVLESNLGYSLTTRWYPVFMAPVLLPIGLVRRLKLLVPFSIFANMLLLIGCILTLFFCFEDMPPVFSRPLVVPVSNWPIFFSTSLFSLEGIGVVMPIENSMENPLHFVGIVNISMGVVAGVYLFMGSAGYIKYGANSKGSITLNLAHNLLSDGVKIFVALAILFSYPLQLTAPSDVAWQRTRVYLQEKHHNLGQYGVRALLVLATVCLAIMVPSLGSVISLVGALGFSGLGLLLPTVTEMVTFWDSLGSGLLVKHLVLLLLWVVASVSGTFISLQSIFSQP